MITKTSLSAPIIKQIIIKESERHSAVTGTVNWDS